MSVLVLYYTGPKTGLEQLMMENMAAFREHYDNPKDRERGLCDPEVTDLALRLSGESTLPKTLSEPESQVFCQLVASFFGEFAERVYWETSQQTC